MAKRARRNVKVVEDVCEYEDGGIYWREKKVGEQEFTISAEEAGRILQAAGDHAGNLAREFQRIESGELERAKVGNADERRDAGEVEYLLRELRAVVSFGADCDALLLAYRLGRLAERLQVRPFEPRVRAHKNLSRGGSNAAGVTNADHVELHPLYQPEVDRLMKYGAADGMSYQEALKAAKKTFGVSISTVDRHTVNKWPRKGGRPKKPTSPSPA